MKLYVLLFEHSVKDLRRFIESSKTSKAELHFVVLEGHSNRETTGLIKSEALGKIHRVDPSEYDDLASYREFYEQPVLQSVWLKAFQNTIHINTIRSLFRRFNALEAFFDRQAEGEIILLGGSRRVEFFTVFYGEGEVPFRFLFHPSWMYNYYFFKKLAGTYKVEFQWEDSAWRLRLAKWVRRNLLIFVKLVFYQLLRAYYFIFDRKGLFYDSQPMLFFSIRSPAQINTVSALLEGFPDIYGKLAITHDLIQAPGLGRTFSKQHPARSLYRKVKLTHLWGFGLLWIRGLMQKSHELKGGVPISSREVILEVLSSFDEYYLKKRALKDCLREFNGSGQAFFSTETYGHTAIMEKDTCEELGIPYFNVQNVIYEFDWIPHFPIAEKTFLFSDDTDWIEPELLSSCQLVGPAWLDLYYKQSERYRQKKTITIFTQPDSYTNDYLEIIRFILKEKLFFDTFEYLIKPHPRETSASLKRYDDLCRQSNGSIRRALGKETSVQLISDSFCVISVSSTVIYESCLVGVPPIGYNPGGKHVDYTHQYPHLKEDYIFVVKDTAALANVIRALMEDNNGFSEKRALAYSQLLPDYQGDAVKKIGEACRL